MMDYMQDFIGVFENALDDELCEDIIDHYLDVHSKGNTISRQQDDCVSPMVKETQMYYLHKETDEELKLKNKEFMGKFSKAIWECYAKYSSKYGSLASINRHRISESIKVQLTKPTQGYHVWHCEHDSIEHGCRVLLALAYLNDVEEGGETEFLYQKLRIKPKRGSLMLCPSGFTHTHRGNPPLSGDKFVINTWIQFFAV